MRGEIGSAHRGAVFFRVRLQFLRQLAAVKRFALGIADAFQRLGVFGEPEKLPRSGRATVRQEGVGEAGLRLELGNLLLPLPGYSRRDEEALAPVLDRLFKELFERQLAPPAVPRSV